MNIPLFSIEEIVQRAKVLFASKLFPDITSEAQAATKIMAGNELGLGPVESCRDLQIIKGRICMSAGLIAARIKASGRYDYEVLELTDDCCRLRFYQEKKQLTPDCQFTKADASKAGLLSNQVWAKFPRNMLFSRALTNGARWFCADVFSGAIYTPDELQGDAEVSHEEMPKFEYKAVTEKTLTHYDGKLSNGKSTDDYTPEKLKQLLTTASTRRKLSARDIELIETALAARSQANGNTEVQAEVSGGGLPSDSAVEGGALRTDVRPTRSNGASEGGEGLGAEGVSGAARPGDSSGAITASDGLDESAAGLRRPKARQDEQLNTGNDTSRSQGFKC